MDIEELTANKEAARAAYRDFSVQIGRKQHEIVESWIRKAGVKNARLRERTADKDRVADYLVIYEPGDNPNDWRGKWSFSFRWREPWPYLDKDTDWRAELNVGTSGSFDCRDSSQVNMYVVAGFMAAHLKEIEDELRGLDWERYLELRHAMELASNKLTSAETAIKEAERQAKIQKIIDGLKVGAEIVTQRETEWQGEAIQKITWMSAKNLTLSGLSCRIRLQDVAERIIDGSWKVAG